MSLKASVIVPAFNSEKTIEKTLNALMEQNFPKNEYEIIVVNDGSTDGTEDVVKKFKNIKLIQQKNAGPAKARNAGAAMAQGEILSFTDSDCIPEKNWLQEMVKPFENKSVAGVQGSYKTTQTEWMARFIQLEIEERYARMKKARHLDWIGSYSAAYRANIFRQVQGFDEGFPKASGEDPELSYRLQEQEHDLVFNPNAIVYHQHPTLLIAYLEKKFQHAFWRVRLYKKHAGKTVHDSYTPLALKLQLIFTIVLGVAWPLHLLYNNFFTILTIVAFVLLLVSMAPLIFFIAMHNLVLAVLAVLLLFLRNLAFLLGLGLGILNLVQR